MTPQIELTFNARELGGLPLSGGGTTRSGILFRSDALDRLTPAGVSRLDELGIGTIVDLRTDSERHRSPDAVPTDSAITLIPLPVQGGAMDELVGQLLPAGGQSGELTDEQLDRVLKLIPTLEDLYVAILASSTGIYAEFARAVIAASDTDRPGVIFHCTAGKDRTGLAAALMLSVAGVPRDEIVADYVRTQTNLAGPFADGLLSLITSLGIPVVPALRTLATESPASAIEAALDWISTTHGDAATYLLAGGLSASELARLTEILRAD